MEHSAELAQSIINRLTLIRYQHRFATRCALLYGIGGGSSACCASRATAPVWAISAAPVVRDATTSPLLERRKQTLIVRRRSLVDSRRLIIEATDKGREVCKEAPLGPNNRLRQALPQLDEPELADLLHALDRLVELADVDPDIAE